MFSPLTSALWLLYFIILPNCMSSCKMFYYIGKKPRTWIIENWIVFFWQRPSHACHCVLYLESNLFINISKLYNPSKQVKFAYKKYPLQNWGNKVLGLKILLGVTYILQVILNRCMVLVWSMCLEVSGHYYGHNSLLNPSHHQPKKKRKKFLGDRIMDEQYKA